MTHSAQDDEVASLTESLEDYLEEIYDQTNARRVARVRDIAAALSVSMSSVTGALKKLAQRGLINYDRYQVITLTDHGRDLAAEIKGRHRILTRFLQEALGVEPEKAETNACRMEHALDRDVADRFLSALEFLQTDPQHGPDWARRFQEFVVDKASPEPSAHAPAESDLADLNAGERATITRIEHAPAGDERIAQFGLLPGASLTVDAKSERDGSLTLRANDRSITLSRQEAEGVHVKRRDKAEEK